MTTHAWAGAGEVVCGRKSRLEEQALVAERDKLECAANKLFADASAMSISPQPVTLSACSAESGATTRA